MVMAVIETMEPSRSRDGVGEKVSGDAAFAPLRKEDALARPESQELLKKREKAGSDALDKINHLMERWENRITIRNLRLSNRFINFELHILLHLRINASEVWGICLEPIIPVEPVPPKQIIMRHGKKGAVFVDIVKLMDSPERIVPAFVWFERIDSFYRFWPHALYFSSLVGFITSEVLRNREFDFSGGFTAGRADEDKLVRQMVKSGTQIVNDVASSSHSIEGQSRQSDKLVAHSETCLDAISRLKVMLSSRYCNVLCDEKVGCKVTEVLFGPLDFYADENQSIVGREWHSPNDSRRRSCCILGRSRRDKAASKKPIKRR